LASVTARSALYLRIKFTGAISESNVYRFVADRRDCVAPAHEEVMSLAPDTFHEFKVPPNLFDQMASPSPINRNDTALLFPLEDGLECSIDKADSPEFCARAATSSFGWLFWARLDWRPRFSFPVAAVHDGSAHGFPGTISQVIEQGTIGAVNHETGVADKPALVDYVALPIFKALLRLIKMVEGFSPIDSLSTGRSISWSELTRAFLQICVLLCGIVAAIGMITFSRRELATAQGTA
jgi:hypothetical protein